MKSVRLRLDHDADTIHPMHRFVAGHDAVHRYRLVHWNFSGDEYTVLVFSAEGDREAYRSALTALEDPPPFDIAPADGRSFYVHVRDRPDETGRALIETFSRGSLVPVSPVEYREDWSVRFTLVGDAEDLQRALADVPEGVESTVRSVEEYRGAAAATVDLTERQREALRVARDLGYFAVPREAGIEDVADELGCAPGTAAEHVRKAEEAVVAELEL